MGRAIAKVFNGAGARVVATDLAKNPLTALHIEFDAVR
jgi:hypothetical protein